MFETGTAKDHTTGRKQYPKRSNAASKLANKFTEIGSVKICLEKVYLEQVKRSESLYCLKLKKILSIKCNTMLINGDNSNGSLQFREQL